VEYGSSVIGSGVPNRASSGSYTRPIHMDEADLVQVLVAGEAARGLALDGAGRVGHAVGWRRRPQAS
jgi:hypothetical protein